MVKYKGISFIAEPKLKPNSCKGCYWYPTNDVIYRETYMIYNKPHSIPTYLLNGCLKMHEGNSGTLCRDLNIVFVKEK